MDNYQKWEEKLKNLSLNKLDIRKIRKSLDNPEAYEFSCPWTGAEHRKCHICMTLFPKIGRSNESRCGCPCSLHEMDHVERVMKKVLLFHGESGEPHEKA